MSIFRPVARAVLCTSYPLQYQILRGTKVYIQVSEKNLSKALTAVKTRYFCIQNSALRILRQCFNLHSPTDDVGKLLHLLWILAFRRSVPATDVTSRRWAFLTHPMTNRCLQFDRYFGAFALIHRSYLFENNLIDRGLTCNAVNCARRLSCILHRLLALNNEVGHPLRICCGLKDHRVVLLHSFNPSFDIRCILIIVCWQFEMRADHG